MKRQQRLPVELQGMSRRYASGGAPPYDADAVISPRAVRIVWAVEVVLCAVWVGLIVAGLAAWGSTPFGFILVACWWPAAVWLHEPARRRPYPSAAAKAAAIVASAAFLAWFSALFLTGMLGGGLRAANLGTLILVGVVGYLVTLAALVFAYRARFFRWRRP